MAANHEHDYVQEPPAKRVRRECTEAHNGHQHQEVEAPQHRVAGELAAPDQRFELLAGRQNGHPGEEIALTSPRRQEGHQYGDVYVNGTNTVVHLGNNYSKTSSYSTAASAALSREEQFKILLQSLSWRKIDFRVLNVQKALHTTCEWLFKHQKFKTWYAAEDMPAHNGFLWIKGKPGCGKSTLMKSAYEWTRRRTGRKRVKDTIIPYFFSARGETSLEKSSLGLFRTVVFQLLTAFPALQDLFMDKFGISKTTTSSEPEWTIEELKDFLLDTVASGVAYSLCLFIDALDEAEHDKDARQMIEFLVELAERAQEAESTCQWQICLSSRHYPHISIGKGMEIVVEKQPEHNNDIDKYISKKLVGLESAEKEELSLDIRQKSANMFLWIVLVVDLLNGLTDNGSLMEDMKNCLSTLPGDLDELSKQILTRNIHGIETSVTLFQWVLFAKRSLEPAELYTAIEYSRSPASSEWVPDTINCPTEDRLKRYILNCSRGLVEVTATAPCTVQFIHETVRDFLINRNGLGSVITTLSGNLPGISHEILKTACDRCVKMHKIPGELARFITLKHDSKSSLGALVRQLRFEMPFLDYAVSHLFDHAERAQIHGIAQATFLQLSRTLNEHYRQWRNILIHHASQKEHKLVTLLYFLTECNYIALTGELLSYSQSDLGIHCGRYCFPLNAACVNASEACIRLLLTHGASLDHFSKKNLGNCRCGVTLISALLKCHRFLGRILTNDSTQSNASMLDRVMRAAIEQNDKPAVRSILNVAAKFGQERVAHDSAQSLLRLSMSKSPDTSVPQLLIDAGANPATDPAALQSLCYVSSRYTNNEDRYAVVAKARLLIEYGADVNAQLKSRNNESDDLSLFDIAVGRAWPGIPDLLIQRGFDIHAYVGVYAHALQAVAAYGNEDLVGSLLKNGCEVNALGGRHGTALIAAAHNGSTSVVQLLLAHGADVNLRTLESNTALYEAIRHGNERIVNILLDHGAHVDATNRNGERALQRAAGYHKAPEEVVRCLLRYGAEVNFSDGRHGTALALAAYHGNEDIVRLLIDEGANAHARNVGHLYETALAAARGGSFGSDAATESAKACRRIEQLLLELGAEYQ